MLFYVVWQEYRNAGSNKWNTDIYMHNIKTVEEKAVCFAPGFQCSPMIYENIIVWTDYRNATKDSSNADIYTYNTVTGQEIGINKNSYQGQATIYQNTIVWYDFSDGKIYIGKVGSLVSVKGDFSVSPI